MLEGEELRQLTEGASLGWRISSEVNECRFDVVQHKRAGIPQEVRFALLNILSQSFEPLVNLEVVVQDGGV